ncbi:DUF4249 family protein [Fulvivirgaceae bacterium BMA10]|uniref:DUF4249 family protein n=1 Tax=Splendidivirga corallicola TaxID=3051826 RepID=A0ABT8KXU4_9BACT|nr:DUF4249 family protein [Fulvivirgaceae bacterium BMA10]
MNIYKIIERIKYHIRSVISILSCFVILGSTGCLTEIDPLTEENSTKTLVVEGGITSELKQHLVTLGLSGNVSGQNSFDPASGAVVTISDGENSYLLMEDTKSPGDYYSQEIAGEPGKSYTLNVHYNGESYQGTDTMVASEPFDPVIPAPIEPGRFLFGKHNKGFYSIELPGNFGNGKPVIYELYYDTPDDWKDNFPYSIPQRFIDRTNWQPRDTTYLIHPALETAALFEYSTTEIVGIPLFTLIRERQYFMSEAHYAFQRSVLMETDWRGVNILQSTPGNVTGNMSNGAYGFFYAMDMHELQKIIEE